MERHEIEEKIRTAVTQATPDQLEDILSACEGDTAAPIRLPKPTRRRPALAALAALVLVALGLGLFPMGEGALSARHPGRVSRPPVTTTAPTALPSQPVPTSVPTQPATDTPVPTPSGYIGSSAALHAALLALELDYDELPYHSEELDWEDGMAIYEVELCHNGVEYDCKIDAHTGQCRGWEQEVCDHQEHQGAHHSDHHADQPAASPSSYIGRDDALERACAHLSLSSADLLGSKAELDWEDGVAVYEVEFCHGGTKYELELDACTGQVLEQDSEPCDDAGHGHSAEHDYDHSSDHGHSGHH